jgi:hypothetical protein
MNERVFLTTWVPFVFVAIDKREVEVTKRDKWNRVIEALFSNELLHCIANPQKSSLGYRQ